MSKDTPRLSDEARTHALQAARAMRTRKAIAPDAGLIRPSPAFETLAGYKERQVLLQAAGMLDIPDPYFRLHEGRAGALTQIAGREILNFGSYDYLGLNADPRPAAAAKAVIDRHGVSASASRLTAGDRPAHRALERALAKHYDVEDALCFVSGHATNISVLTTLLGKGDLVIHDAFIHNSTSVGATYSGASRRSFPHNDLDALEQLLSDTAGRYRATLVVVEGHYSMDGDIPDLARLIRLKQTYGFWLMVDEAHGLGCIGPTGKGVREVYDVAGADVDIWMGTLSKSLGSTGGYIAGSATLIDILKFEAPGSVYSVALAPALAAAAECSLGILAAEPERVARLQSLGQLFLDCARQHGLDTGKTVGASIIPVIVGSSVLATAASGKLLEEGINVLPVAFPGVPMNEARLRFFISCLHDEDQIRHAVAKTAEVLRVLHEGGLDARVQRLLEMKP